MTNKVHSDAEAEPHVQHIKGGNINGLTGDDTRPDIRARSVCEMEKTHSSTFVLQTLMPILSITSTNCRETGERKNASTIIVL